MQTENTQGAGCWAPFLAALQASASPGGVGTDSAPAVLSVREPWARTGIQADNGRDVPV